MATVGHVSPGGAIGRDGQLLSGDVIRSVNGTTCYTCEAVVSAIKAARRAGGGTAFALEGVRPPAEMQVWRWCTAMELEAPRAQRLRSSGQGDH